MTPSLTPLCPELKRIGMLTPSSNTALEPMTYRMLSALPHVSAHFARFRVVEISIEATERGQFDEAAILPAAELLADARMDIITWNGTSAAWTGFDSDDRLCRRISEVTGIAATTSILALNEKLAATAVRRYGLVSPYDDDVQARIIASYDKIGLTCVAESHLGLMENFIFAELDEKTIRRQVDFVAKSNPEVIIIACTNLHATHLVASLEAEHGIPIYDTIATAVWKSLDIIGADYSAIRGWGSLFSVGGRAANGRSQ